MGSPLPQSSARNAIRMQAMPKPLSDCSKLCFIHSIFPSGLSRLGLSTDSALSWNSSLCFGLFTADVRGLSLRGDSSRRAPWTLICSKSTSCLSYHTLL